MITVSASEKMLKRNKKGMILFIVLSVLLVVAILSVAILEVISSHARLTHHQVTRIQAQYAARAGLLYGLEQLRLGNKKYPTDCTPASPCAVTDTFPASVTSVIVTFVPGGLTRKGTNNPSIDNAALCIPPAGYDFCVSATATYTYNPS
jgi:Tfp pilus assembly protein PilX